MTAIELTPESIEKLIKEKKKKEKKEKKEKKKRKKEKKEQVETNSSSVSTVKKKKSKGVKSDNDVDDVQKDTLAQKTSKDEKVGEDIDSTQEGCKNINNDELNLDHGEDNHDENVSLQPSKKSADKKKKKDKKDKSKKRKSQSESRNDRDNENKNVESDLHHEITDTSDTDKETSKADESKNEEPETSKKRHKLNEASEKRQAKKAAKEALLAKVPTRDEHGIAYTKIQIRRMMKRVKRGLHPVPTEEEENKRRREIKLEKKLEQEEWADMIYQRKKDGAEDSGENDDANNSDIVEENVEEGNTDEETENENLPTTDEIVNDEQESSVKQESDPIPIATRRSKKKARRTKPVPPDYVCMACKNKHEPKHWIYDCPDKITMPGTNKKSNKQQRQEKCIEASGAGVHDPDSRKVFVSGLPFDIKTKEVQMYFEMKTGGKVLACKLLTFEDTGRCKGNAFITFDSEKYAELALKMNGNTFLRNDEDNENENDNTEGDKKRKKKDLKLGVTKVLNRLQTKYKKNNDQKGFSHV